MNAQMLSDRELLNDYLQGNKSAISTLLEKYNSRVRNYLRMMVGDDDVAADIAQETFIKALRVIDEGRYTDSGKFLSWIMRIAHNKALDYFRSQKSNNSVSESSAGYNVLGTMKYADRSIEDSMISDQISADIRALVELLPDEQREVVKLRYYSDLSFKEIAEQTGVSINTALGRMRYALINLRKMIQEKKISLN
ncbi:MAG: RNA polymerase sigma factor [Alistipes sp.]|nr:RNA polymerase sigma factor [Alistipes sp.]MBR5885595.1 RNA polymerase sigma factor [Alistipes sp.]